MRSKGFTLLEVLVAISIFAIIGLGANTMLRTVIDTQSRVKTDNEAFSGLSRALAMIERDLSHAVARGVRDEYGEPLAALMIGEDLYALEFTRAGWNNPARHPRSELQRVAYQVEDEILYRYFWLVLDRAEDSEPQRQLLLRDVQSFRVNAMDLEGETDDSWPPLDANTVFPPAIEISLEAVSTGEIRRVYGLTDLPTTSRQRSDNDQDLKPGEDEDSAPGKNEEEIDNIGAPIDLPDARRIIR
jgi:general secretion pathway protein J